MIKEMFHFLHYQDKVVQSYSDCFVRFHLYYEAMMLRLCYFEIFQNCLWGYLLVGEYLLGEGGNLREDFVGDPETEKVPNAKKLT